MDATIRTNPLVIRLSNGDSISERRNPKHPSLAPVVYDWYRKGGKLAQSHVSLPMLLTIALAPTPKP